MVSEVDRRPVTTLAAVQAKNQPIVGPVVEMGFLLLL